MLFKNNEFQQQFYVNDFITWKKYVPYNYQNFIAYISEKPISKCLIKQKEQNVFNKIEFLMADYADTY